MSKSVCQSNARSDMILPKKGVNFVAHLMVFHGINKHFKVTKKRVYVLRV